METNIEGRLVVVSNVYLDNSLTYFPTNGGNVNMTNLSGETFSLRVDARVTEIAGQPIPSFASAIIGVMASPALIGPAPPVTNSCRGATPTSWDNPPRVWAWPNPDGATGQ